MMERVSERQIDFALYCYKKLVENRCELHSKKYRAKLVLELHFKRKSSSKKQWG